MEEAQQPSCCASILSRVGACYTAWELRDSHRNARRHRRAGLSSAVPGSPRRAWTRQPRAKVTLVMARACIRLRISR